MMNGCEGCAQVVANIIHSLETKDCKDALISARVLVRMLEKKVEELRKD